MPLRVDLQELNTLSADVPDRTYCLSAETVNLALFALDALSARWVWGVDGASLTDAQWDEADAIVGEAVEQLMTEGACS